MSCAKRFVFTSKNHFGHNVKINIGKNADVVLGSDFSMRDNTILSVRDNAVLVTGEEVFFNAGCQIVVHKEMRFGNRVKVGNNTLFFDHDHDYRVPGGVSARKYVNGTIEIGDDCWIGAGCIILKNTKLGKNCVVAAGSVLHGEYPDNTFIVQKRIDTIRHID